MFRLSLGTRWARLRDYVVRIQARWQRDAGSPDGGGATHFSSSDSTGFSIDLCCSISFISW
ncbi:MAG: hypothetical protein VB817_06585, partial [Pirellulaceae bacterium]